MKATGIKLVKISELVFDEALYPRLKIGWLTAYSYAQAIRAGRTLPPITVGLFKGKMYVVDGWHRVEAMKMLHEGDIQAIVNKYESRRDIFVDSVKTNVTHGRQLSVQEKVRIVDVLKGYSFTLEQVSDLVAVPLDKMQMFEARIVTMPNGSKMYLKSVVNKAAGEDGDSTLLKGLDQDGFNVRDANSLVSQLITLAETKTLPLDDEKLKEKLVHLLSLLQDMLQFA